jgi:hypothetical protein
MSMRLSSTRRVFMMQVASAAGVALVAQQAAAQPMVQETDAQAKSLGYVADAAKVDKAKYPKFAANQNCASCALFQAKAGAASGGCGIFPGKQVAAKGWCSAWAKKA